MTVLHMANNHSVASYPAKHVLSVYRQRGTKPAAPQTYRENPMTATQTTAQDKLTAMNKTMKSVRQAVFAITAVTMIASYQHQVHTLTKNGAGWAGWILPAPLDLLVLALMKISQLQGISARARMTARLLLLAPATGSAYINFVGDGTPLLKCFYAGLILAIVIGDLAVSLIKLDPTVAAAIQAAADAQAAAQADADAAAQLAAKRQEAAAKGLVTKAANKAAKEAAKKTTTRTPRTRKADADTATTAHPVAAFNALTPDQIADAPTSPAPWMGQNLVVAHTMTDVRSLTN